MQFSAVGFGLLLVASLAIPALWEAAAPAPGLSVIFCGLFIGTFAELLDPGLRRFAVALRFAGAGVAFFGLVLRFL